MNTPSPKGPHEYALEEKKFNTPGIRNAKLGKGGKQQQRGVRL